jgi:hypothetical protein
MAKKGQEIFQGKKTSQEKQCPHKEGWFLWQQGENAKKTYGESIAGSAKIRK